MAFVTVAVHTGSLGDIASACTATTTDNEGRFSFSGFKVGVGASWIVLYNVPFPFSHCLGGKMAWIAGVGLAVIVHAEDRRVQRGNLMTPESPGSGPSENCIGIA